MGLLVALDRRESRPGFPRLPLTGPDRTPPHLADHLSFFEEGNGVCESWPDPARLRIVIVIVGSAGLRPAQGEERDPSLVGRAPDMARAAAAAGADVELVARVPDDDRGDDLLLALSRAGVGHAAVLRDAAKRSPADDDGQDTFELESADIELALRYLTDFRVVVLAEAFSGSAGKILAEAVAFADAHLVAALPAGADASLLPASATVLEAPEDAEGYFGALVGTYAAALDRGRSPEQSDELAHVRQTGIEPTPPRSRREDDRHAVVQLGDRSVRPGGYDRERPSHLPGLRIVPAGP